MIVGHLQDIVLILIILDVIDGKKGAIVVLKRAHILLVSFLITLNLTMKKRKSYLLQ